MGHPGKGQNSPTPQGSCGGNYCTDRWNTAHVLLALFPLSLVGFIAPLCVHRSHWIGILGVGRDSLYLLLSWEPSNQAMLSASSVSLAPFKVTLDCAGSSVLWASQPPGF